MHRVLLIAYFFPPCAEGGVQRARAFARHLPTYGWQPFVLTVRDDYYLSFTKDEELVREFAGNLTIVRTNSLEPKGSLAKQVLANVYGVGTSGKWFDKYVKGFLRQIYRILAIPDEHILWLPHALRAGLQMIKEHKINVIVCTTPPHSAGVIALLLSWLSGRSLVWDVRDDWVGNPLFDPGPWHRRTLARFLERRLVNRSAAVVSVTRESRESFRSKYPRAAPDKFRSLPNGYDAEEISEIRDELEPREHERLRIVYTGTLGATRSPAALFEALQEIHNEFGMDDLLRLDFYGYARAEFSDLSQAMGLANIVKFHGFVSRRESLRQILMSDVALMIIPEAEGSRIAVPGKLYEYMGAGRFVLALCPFTSAAARIVNEYGDGLVVSQYDASALKAALKQIISLHKAHALGGGRPLEYAKKFERGRQTQVLASYLDSLHQ
jgi:glycosyltransferase involved in cell wall biosynthesis